MVDPFALFSPQVNYIVVLIYLTNNKFFAGSHSISRNDNASTIGDTV